VNNCTHAMGTPGRLCPWRCGSIVPESVSLADTGARPQGGDAGDCQGSEASPRMAPVGEFVPGESADRKDAAGSSSPVLALPAQPSQSRPVAAPPLADPHDGLTLFDLYVEPVARLTDPDTAHEAAHRARSRSAADADLVLKAHARAGEQGLTGYELEKATGRPYQSVGPRRPSLEAAGLIVKAEGVRRTNARGNAEQVYRITADGLRAAARLLEVAA